MPTIETLPKEENLSYNNLICKGLRQQNIGLAIETKVGRAWNGKRLTTECYMDLLSNIKCSSKDIVFTNNNC